MSASRNAPSARPGASAPTTQTSSSSASDRSTTGAPARRAGPPEPPLTGGLEWGRILLFLVVATPIVVIAILYRLHG